MHKIFVFLSLILWISGAAAQQASVSLEPDTNRPGMDYRSFDLQDDRPELCRQACERDEKCRAYTYIKPGIQGPQARCWLKSGIPAPKKGGCCVSGVKTITTAQGQQPKPMKFMPGTTQIPPKPSASTPGSPPVEGHTAVLSGKGQAPMLKVPPVPTRIPQHPLNRKEVVGLLLANPLTAPRLNQLASTTGMPANALANKSTSGKLVTGGPETVPASGATKYLNWEAGVRFTPRSNKAQFYPVKVSGWEGFGLSEMCQRDEIVICPDSDYYEMQLLIDMPPGKYAITIEFTEKHNIEYICYSCKYPVKNPFPLMDKKALAEGISIYTGYFEVPVQAKVHHIIESDGACSFFRGITFTRF